MTRGSSAAGEVQPKKENTLYVSGRVRLSPGEPLRTRHPPGREEKWIPGNSLEIFTTSGSVLRPFN
jgi:hypothetical protein